MPISVYATRHGMFFHLNAMCGRYTYKKIMTKREFIEAFYDGKFCSKCIPSMVVIELVAAGLEKDYEERTQRTGRSRS